MKVVAFVLGVFIAAMFFSPLCQAQVPHMIHYQGKITTPQGYLISDTVSMQISIYRDSIGGTPLWTEIQNPVQLDYGIFDILLGTVTPIPDSVFDGNVRYLGLRVRNDPEMSPRKAIASVGYAMRAGNAGGAMLREIYHQIIDVMPNSSTKFYVVPKNPPTKVTLYLYGEPFAGALLAHTHSGNNAHSHTYSGTTGAESADHTHNFSGNTGLQSANHTHSGTTSTVDETHSHSGSVGYTDLSHSHSGTTSTVSNHSHVMEVDGTPGTGNFLVHTGDVNGLSASDTHDRIITQSIDPAGSHSHSFTTAVASLNHNHSLSINSSLGLHSHTFTTGGVSADHYHGFSGTTGGISANHTHNFSGTTGSSGTGLDQTGVLAGTLPQVVRVYVDGQLAAGPWSGNFASGPIDLSQYISNANQHTVEIKEEGGNGGRIIYNLYIE